MKAVLALNIAILLLSILLQTNGVPISKTTSLHSAYHQQSTPLGEVQGSMLTSRQGKHIYAFRGIRYAKAPINELRFQPPVPVEKWDGVYNATQDGPSCPQKHLEDTNEDCLMLNVYTTKLPKLVDNPKRPVVIYFHGGDFNKDSARSNFLGPQHLLDSDIVLVTVNYRLGVLGFLNTGDKEATGNYGLKDQVEAMKWVKHNIAAFGGNPDSVTIAGTGSGAVSVNLHLVSPLSKGLFHKAIVSSGSVLGNIPIHNNQLNLGKKLGGLLKCPNDTSSNLIKCLKNKSAAELAEHNCQLKEFGSDPYYTWLPTMEQDFGQQRFLSAHPIEIMSHGQINAVPVMIGINTDDFGFKAFEVTTNKTLLEQLDKEFDKYAPIAFMYERDSDNSKAISKEIRQFYFQDAKINEDSLPKLSELYTDALVGFASHRAAELFAQKINESVYYYRFNFKGKYSNFYLPCCDGNPYGVVHGDENIYLFHSKFPEFKDGEEEVAMLQKLTAIWTNFITTGKPIPNVIDTLDNVKWEPFTTKSKKYMDIGNKLSMHENLNEKRYALWEKLFPTNKYTKHHAG